MSNKEEFREQYIEYLKDKIEKNEGIGGLYNSFFSGADSKFQEYAKNEISKAALIGKLLADKIRESKNDPSVRNQLEEALRSMKARKEKKESEENQKADNADNSKS